MPIVLIIGAVIIATGVGAFVFLSRDTSPETSVDIIRIEEIEEIVIPEPTDIENEITNEDDDQMEEVQSEPTTNTGASGTFSASGEYLTPARTEHDVAVSLTLTNDIVTDVSVKFDGNSEPGQYSNANQGRFDAAYKELVIGKRLDEISLSRVGGASLTSRAFNEAVAQIRDQASW